MYRSLINNCVSRTQTLESTYREVLGDILLDETNISSISGALSLLVHLVLVASEFGGSLGGFHLSGVCL
jgi:hypothetical protein